MHKEQMLKFTNIELSPPEKRETRARSSDFREIYVDDSSDKIRDQAKIFGSDEDQFVKKYLEYAATQQAVILESLYDFRLNTGNGENDVKDKTEIDCLENEQNKKTEKSTYKDFCDDFYEEPRENDKI